MEASADESALRFLRSTHQSAKGMLTVFDRLASESLASTQYADPYLYSHPMPLDRLRALEQQAKALPDFNRLDSGALQLRHDLVKAKLIGFMETPKIVFERYPKTDKSLPARYARAITLFRSGDMRNALPIIDTLIKDLPQSPYFWELKGQALLESGKAQAALQPLNRARELLPNNGLLQILYAQAQVGTQTSAGARDAIKVLNKAQRTEGNSPELYKLLAQAHAANRDVPRAELATAEFALLTGDRELAQEKAKFAQGQFGQGTPEWLRAADILAAAKRTKK
jgi:predicted Zn-dependent protease